MIDKGLARSVINKRIGMLKKMFRWAASQQLVPVTVYQALATVENLRAGRYRAKEHKTAYRGHTRLIAIGPKGQRILRPFLKRKLDAVLRSIDSKITLLVRRGGCLLLHQFFH